MRQLPGTVPVSAILTEETFGAADALARFAFSEKGAGAIVSFQGITRPETKAGETLGRLKTDAMFWKREEGTFGSRWIAPTHRDQYDRTRWNYDQSQN